MRLIDAGRFDEARRIILDRPMDPTDALIAIGRIPDNDAILLDLASENVSKVDSSSLISILEDEAQSIHIKTAVAQEIITRGLEGTYLNTISDIATQANKIELLSEILGDEAIEQNPLRGLLVWHLLSARIGINKLDQLISLKQKSIEALQRIEDSCLSEVSVR